MTWRQQQNSRFGAEKSVKECEKVFLEHPENLHTCLHSLISIPESGGRMLSGTEFKTFFSLHKVKGTTTAVVHPGHQPLFTEM